MSQQSFGQNNSSNPSEVFRAPLPISSRISTENAVKPFRPSKFSTEPSTNSTNGSRTRVSKFSSHPPGTIPPPGVIATQASKVDAVAAAAAAAAKINANLRAKGKLSDQTLLKPVVNPTSNTPLSLIKISETKKVFSSYVAKIDINDLPLSIRTHFTQVSVQESINAQTGAAISTKGQHLTIDEKKHLEGIEKQLHLCIQSPSQEKTDATVTKLKEMIAQHKTSAHPVNSVSAPTTAAAPVVSVRSLPIGQPSLPTGSFVQEKVFIGMDYCVPEFDLKTKLIGVNYANFNFVANSTGAKVILRGRGSGFIEPTSGREAFESMYVFVSHINQNGVDSAKNLVYNLISTVKSEYSSFMAKKMGGPPLGNFPPTTGQFPPYPPSAPINPYNSMVPPPANPYLPNPYSVPPPPVPPSSYPVPPVRNPYNPQIPPPPISYNMPPPAGNFASKPNRDAPTENKSHEPKPATLATEPKAKRRRFQEEQPDDSNVLGYKQYSYVQPNNSDDTKRSKKRHDKTSVDERPSEKLEEQQTSNLPFWMSHG